MSEHLERETQISTEVSVMPDGVIEALPSALDDDAEGFTPELRDLIKRCMDGAEPYDRPLKPLEPGRLTARHVNICLLRAAGFKNLEIAEALDYTPVLVSQIVNHPYGRKIIHAIVTHRGGRVLDIRTKLDNYASEILDQMYTLASKSEDLEAVSKVGFGLLDRAGYSTTQKIQHTMPVGHSESALQRVASALEQSASVDAAIMPTFVRQPPPDESRDMGSGQPSDRSASVAPADRGLSLDGGVKLAKAAGQ